MNKKMLCAGMLLSMMVASVASAAGPVELSAPKVSLKKWRIGDAKGKFYVNFEAMAKVTGPVDAKALMSSKFECKSGTQEVVDTPLVLGGSKLKDLTAGQSTKLSMMGFGIRNALDAKPTQCTVTIQSSTGYGAKKQTTDVAAFCWKGKGVTPGACPK